MLQMLDEAGAAADVRPALALLAAPEPLIEPDELTPALRRAMLLLAASRSTIAAYSSAARALSSTRRVYEQDGADRPHFRR